MGNVDNTANNASNNQAQQSGGFDSTAQKAANTQFKMPPHLNAIQNIVQQGIDGVKSVFNYNGPPFAQSPVAPNSTPTDSTTPIKTGVSGLAGADTPAMGKGMVGQGQVANVGQGEGEGAGQDMSPTNSPDNSNATPGGGGGSGTGDSNPSGMGDGTMETPLNTTAVAGHTGPEGDSVSAATLGGETQTAKAQPNFWDNILGIAGMLGKGVGEILGNTGLIYMGQPSISQTKAGYRQALLLQQRDIDLQKTLQSRSLYWAEKQTNIYKDLQLKLQNIDQKFQGTQNAAERQKQRDIAYRGYSNNMDMYQMQALQEQWLAKYNSGRDGRYGNRSQ
jgi:hypothetical protein